MNKQKILFAIARAAHKATAADYWRHINGGARTRSRLSVNGPLLAPGTVLNATDRAYVVTKEGSWRVQRHFTPTEQLPASKSQIRLLPVVTLPRIRKQAL